MISESIAIVGGGIAGLVAAIELEEFGFSCHIFEKETELGGRVRSTIKNGITMDHGFQVLLTAYPLAKKYLDYDALKLRYFDPGALIMKNGAKTVIGDPLRDKSQFFPTLFSWAASISDKFKILSLSQKLKSKSVDAIFKEEETTTFLYLQNFGFSNKVINHFFKPFFTGIYLEDKLETSSRMFEFIFKMFAEGHAAIPEGGMGQIAVQLHKKLRNTTLHLGQEANIKEDGTILAGNQKFRPSAIIKAFPEIIGIEEQWKSCTTYYFKVDRTTNDKAIIGLISDEDALINSWFFLNNLNPEIAEPILVVTVVENAYKGETDTRLEQEINKKLGLNVKETMGKFHVPFSLPRLDSVSDEERSNFEMIASTPMVTATDQQNYGSLNGAMLSGSNAAKRLHDYFNSQKV